MSQASGLRAVWRPLRSRNYVIFSSASEISHVGTWAQRVAVGWLTWELTHSGLWLGLISFADLFPTILFAPLTGAVADRVDRIWLMKICQALAILQGVALAVLTFSGLITIEILFAATFLLGTTISFNQPARLAIVPSLVAREDLAAAIGLNSVIFNIARFVGPAVSGLVIAGFGVGAAFAFNAITYSIFLLSLFFLRIPAREEARAPSSVRNIPQEIASGYSYAARHTGIGPMLVVLIVLAICARPYTELLPGFAGAVFNEGADGLALLTSATGLGAALGGLWLAQRGSVVGLTRISVWSVLILALALLLFTATSDFVLGVVILFFAGFAMIITGVAEQTLMQNAVDPSMRGRVMGLYGMIQRGGPALGALGMGALSEHFGLRWPLAAGAVVCIGLFVWALRRTPTMAPALEGEPPGGEKRPPIAQH